MWPSLTRVVCGTMNLFGTSTISLYYILLYLYILLIWTPTTEPYRHNSHRIPFNITAATGITVDLKCKVRLNECGHFYSIEWYWQKSQNQRKPSLTLPIETRDETFIGNINDNQGLSTVRFGDVLSSNYELQAMESAMLNEGVSASTTSIPSTRTDT